jgi:hypothetical protein
MLNIPSVSTPIHKRLQMDFDDESFRREPQLLQIEIPDLKTPHVSPRKPSYLVETKSPLVEEPQTDEQSIEEFISHNWDFFHDDSENGGANMDISMLNKIVEENYGNYIRNMFVRKCQ